MSDMSGIVLIFGSASDEPHGRRLRALAGAHERLARLAGVVQARHQPTPAELLAALAGAGRVSVEGEGPWTLWYVPDPATADRLAGGTLPSWSARVDAKQQKAVRRVPGAVFRFPFADGEGELAAFITDWSPFVAACAIAVHPDHELLAGRAVPALPGFTGRFVRHPLHGDLLPVWVADWVKPEFGTGAVIVNPAHSAADLAFARAVGLPVRFGLGPAEPTTDPAGWLDPPVVKSGKTIRAGRYADLPHAEAAEAYLRDLREAGWAEQVVLSSAGRFRLATLTRAEAGELTWSPSLRARGLADASEGVTVAVEPAPLLAGATALRAPVPPPVLAAADAVAEDLLGLRLLAADLDASRVPEPVVLVAKVGAVRDVPDQWLDATLTVAGRPDEAVSVKGQLADQVARVVDSHDPATPAGAVDDPAAVKAATRTLDALRTGDFPAAFAGAAATAKTLRRGGQAGPREHEAYLLTTHVLFGLPLPAAFHSDRLSDLGGGS
jgi:leucyl-tRNA synthetase